MHEHSHLIVLPNYSPKTDIKSSACLATQSRVAMHFPLQRTASSEGNSTRSMSIQVLCRLKCELAWTSAMNQTLLVQTIGACDSLDRPKKAKQLFISQFRHIPRLFRRPYDYPAFS